MSAPRVARSSSARLKTADCSADSSSRACACRARGARRAAGRGRARRCARAPKRCSPNRFGTPCAASSANRARSAATSSSLAGAGQHDLEPVAAQVAEAQLVRVARGREHADAAAGRHGACARSGSSPGTLSHWRVVAC